ncbi:MAG: hypothetical protein IKF82_07445 [Bacilli bacterium]|nr:hypothetical protein [Bacilli bacterium]
MIPMYNTQLFTEIWDSAEKFLAEYKASPFYVTNNTLTDDNVVLTFYLLYNKYGNNPIANYDVNQFKFKVFGVMLQYGPAWAMKLSIQEKVRSLGVADDSEIYKGSKAIYNHAFNPETTPKTGDLEEINFINDQNTTSYKKSKLEGLATLAEVLRDDVTATYIDKFRKMFNPFVKPVAHVIYVEEEEEDIEA